ASTGAIDSRLGSSFDRPASPEYAFGLAHLTKVASYVVSSGGPGGDYTSSSLSSLVLVYSRHADSAITDPQPPPSSYDASKGRRLNAFVVKLCDMHEGVLVLSSLSQVWRSLTCDPIMRYSNENVMGIYDFLCLPEWE
nr:hypothetical protein [Tanacetum cinerariifolium]